MDLRGPAQKCHGDRCCHSTLAVPEAVVDIESLAEVRGRFASHRCNGQRRKDVVQSLTGGDTTQNVDMLTRLNLLQKPDPDAGKGDNSELAQGGRDMRLIL